MSEAAQNVRSGQFSHMQKKSHSLALRKPGGHTRTISKSIRQHLVALGGGKCCIQHVVLVQNKTKLIERNFTFFFVLSHLFLVNNSVFSTGMLEKTPSLLSCALNPFSKDRTFEAEFGKKIEASSRRSSRLPCTPFQCRPTVAAGG